MWPLYVYLAFIPIYWLLGWAYIAYKKAHEVDHNEIDELSLVIIFSSFIWPAVLVFSPIIYIIKIFWRFGARLQDKLVAHFKAKHTISEKTYGESTYRKPPKAI